MSKWFKGITSSTELSKKYKELAKQYHPDMRNKDKEDTTAIFQEILNDYTECLDKLKIEKTDTSYSFEVDNIVGIFYYQLNTSKEGNNINKEQLFKKILRTTFLEQKVIGRDEFQEISKILKMKYSDVLIIWLETKETILV